jgi:hypothetical protein
MEGPQFLRCRECDADFVARLGFSGSLRLGAGLGDAVCPNCGFSRRYAVGDLRPPSPELARSIAMRFLPPPSLRAAEFVRSGATQSLIARPAPPPPSANLLGPRPRTLPFDRPL